MMKSSGMFLQRALRAMIGLILFCINIVLRNAEFGQTLHPCESQVVVQWRTMKSSGIFSWRALTAMMCFTVCITICFITVVIGQSSFCHLWRRWTVTKESSSQKMKEKMADSQKKEKGFFKVFIPESSSQRMKIPPAFEEYKGKLPKKVSLRDKYGNMWPIGLAKKEGATYFQEGWEKFIEENSLEFGDFLIFYYDKSGVFDFKLLGNNACEKTGAGRLKSDVKEEEETSVVQKSEEPKGMILEDDTYKSSSDSDNDEDYKVEDDEDEEEEEHEEVEEEEEENENAFLLKRRSPNSKAKRKRGNTIKKTDLPDQSEELEDEADEEEDNENATVLKKKSPRSNGKGRRATSSKKKHLQDQYEEVNEETDLEEEDNEKAIVLKRKSPRSKAQRRRIKEDLPDYCGADIFKSGRAVQPTNPYFVARIRAERRDQLYIPVDVIRDYNLELPPRMIICDSTGRKFKTDIKHWRDGRIWLSGDWIHLCRWNLVEKDDQCICETLAFTYKFRFSITEEFLTQQGKIARKLAVILHFSMDLSTFIC